jgi:hypothetical protein
MSSVTTSRIDTRDGTTNLTLTTGNTTGAAVIVGTSNTISLRSNSTFNVLTTNSSSVTSNLPVTFANTANATREFTFSNTVTVNGNTTFNSNVSANTISLNTATISSNTLNLGEPALSTTGWSRMPNGLLWQWGSVAANSSTGDITFTTPFGTLYSITATAVGTVAGATYATTFLAANTTTANVRTANTNSRTVYWQAIGV